MPLDNNGNDLKKYKKNLATFIETGTADGDGIQSALTAGFEIIHSVELSDSLFENCMNRFSNNDNVNLYVGSSEEVLPMIIEKMDEPFLLWLDAHTSGGPYIGEPMHNYLPREMESIMQYKDKLEDSVIMIDDMGHYLEDKNFCALIEFLLQKLKPNGKQEYYRPENTNFVILVSV
jgi:hypothetical protein